MNSTSRALLGALAGALLVMVAHPGARSYVMQGVTQVTPSEFLKTTPHLASNNDTLEDPVTQEANALWILVAAERIRAGDVLSQDEIILLAEIAQSSAETDPDNAFWRQAESTFLLMLGNYTASLDAWRNGAICSRYHDPQVNRLEAVARGLANESGREFAWHWALMAAIRSDSIAWMILNHGERLVNVAPEPQQLEVRYLSVLNGRLLRDGGKHVRSSKFGSQLIEVGVMGKQTLPFASSSALPREEAEARGAFLRQIRTRFSESMYSTGQDALSSNEAFNAMVSQESVDQNFTRLVRRSVLSGGGPGALLLTGVFGLVLYLAGSAIRRFSVLEWIFTPRVAPVLGVVLGALTYLLTGFVFPAIWVTVTFALYAILPSHTYPPKEASIELAFNWWQTVIAGVATLAMAIFLLGLSRPAIHLDEFSDWPYLFRPGSAFSLSAATACLTFSLGAGPLFGLYLNQKPKRLAGQCIQYFGWRLLIAAWTLCVLLTAVAIAQDRSLSTTLEMIFRNETVYYWTQ